MKYEKAIVEVVRFGEYLEFMAGSLQGNHCNNYKLANGGQCNSYNQGSQCSEYTDADGNYCPSYSGIACSGYKHENPEFTCGYFFAYACYGYGEGPFGWLPPDCDNFSCSGF